MRPSLATTVLAAALLTFPAAAPAADGAEEAAARKAVARYFEALEKRDARAFEACLAPDYGGSAAARAQFVKGWEGYFRKTDPVRWVAAVSSVRPGPGGTYIARLRYTATFRADGKDEVLDDYKALVLARDDGTWKVREMRPSSLDMANLLAAAKTRAEAVALLRAEGDKFLAEEFLPTVLKEKDNLLEAGNFSAAAMLQVFVELAAEAFTAPDRRAWGRGQALLGKGRNDLYAGRYAEAVAAFREATELYTRDPARAADEVVARTQLGTAQWTQGDAPGAVETLTPAAAKLPRLAAFERRAYEPGLLNSLGQAHAELGEFTRAAELLAEAARLAEAAGGRITARAARTNLATVRMRQGRPREAVAVLEGIVEDAGRRGERLIQGRLSTNLGAVFLELGRYADATRRFEDAVRLAKAVGDRAGLAGALFGLAALHQKWNENDEAERYNNQAIDLMRAVGDRVGLARALRMAGHLHFLAGRVPEAERAYAECGKLVVAGENKWAAAELALALAADLDEYGRPEGAAEMADLAARLYRELDNPFRETSVRLLRLVLRDKEGKIRPDRAALERLRADVTRIDDPRLSRSFYELAGTLNLEEGRWAAAAADFRASVAADERLLETVDDPVLRISARAFRIDKSYSGLAVALAESGDAPGVYRAAEAGRGRVLTGLLRRGGAGADAGLAPPDREQSARLRERVSAATQTLLAARFRAEFTDADRARLRNDLAAAQAGYAEVRRQLLRADPGLRVRQADLPTPTLEEVQAEVFARNPGAAVLSYVVADNRTLVVVLTAGKAGGPARVAVHRVAVTEQALTDAVGEFRKACQTPAGGAPAGDQLWDWLIAPAAADLDGKAHLIVVPSGPLLGLPFHALRKAGEPYLVERHAVSYTPSVAALVELRRRAARRAPPAGPVVAVGGVTFTRDLTPLPASGPEAEAVAGAYGAAARVLLGDQATRARVGAAAKTARVLHLATHGLVNEDRPLFSAVALTPEAGDDGRLYAHELMEWDLAADLVVLSACESGRGKDYRGEGTLGLGWACLAAGASAEVVTLWVVADAATADLMGRFYRRLTGPDPPSKAEALRQAQLALLKDRKTRHPFYWAPFMLVGDPGAP